jgi:Polyketide cyclase / dehydrase and lipid transport
MWATEYSIEATATPSAVWRVWSDVGRWPEWNADLERAELSGAFVEGSTTTMYQRGGGAIELRAAEVVEPERFVDEADLGDVVVRTIHRIETLEGDRRVRVVYRIEIRGPQADTLGPQIGPEISADFPEVLAALVQRAER